MEIRPQVLFDRPPASPPRISLILLDWSCRESFHVFDYLAKQDVPRDWFEVLWIEYYDRAAPEIGRRIDEARRKREAPPVDRWVLLNMPRTAYYHKHLMYNVGVLASRGDLVMIGDSDAMLTPAFVRTLVEAFEQDRRIVLHLDEVRSNSRRFYPFNYPTFEEVLADGATNWRDGKTTGVLDTFDPLHTRNYGACICARREDVIAIGGADEHIDYLGHICGPYDLTWRLVNFGRREVWHESEFLYHVWHPGSDGADNYLGPHDGRHVSTLALQTRRNGRVKPLVENRMIRHVRHKEPPPSGSLEDVIRLAIGNRPLTEWVIDDAKRALSAGRAAWAERRHRDAIAIWEPLRVSLQSDSRFLNDLGWSYYFVGRYDDARAAFEEAIRHEGDNPDAHRGLGWTLEVQGHHASAVPEFTAALEVADPIDRVSLVEAYRGRAWARFHVGEFDGAGADFTSALELVGAASPDALQDVERGLGWVRLRQGDGARAIVHFSRALHALGDRPGPEYDNAVTGLEAASQAIDGRVSARPQPSRGERLGVRSRLRCDLADAFYAARQYEPALVAYKEAVAIEKHNARAACGLGWSALHLGLLSEARSAFARILQAAGAEPQILRDAHRGCAWIAYRDGRVGEAIKEFKRALKGADRAREAATVRDVERGLRRARYLAGEADVTLGELARREQKPRIELAVRLGGRKIRNRLSTVLENARRGRG